MTAIRRASLLGDQRSVKSLDQAKRAFVPTAFLCHSHKDKTLVVGVSNLLVKSGWSVYIDWLDTRMPDKPDRRTADRIKNKIRDLDYFLFLATGNSVASRWCPWEIGYADPHKYPEKLPVIPTRDGQTTRGNEYLDLYKRIDLRSDCTLATIDPGSSYGTELRNLR